MACAAGGAGGSGGSRVRSGRDGCGAGVLGRCEAGAGEGRACWDTGDRVGLPEVGPGRGFGFLVLG